MDDEMTPERVAQGLARERLQRAMALGDYDGLLDPALWQLLDRAAGSGSIGFGREIGALGSRWPGCWPRSRTHGTWRRTWPG